MSRRQFNPFLNYRISFKTFQFFFTLSIDTERRWHFFFPSPFIWSSLISFLFGTMTTTTMTNFAIDITCIRLKDIVLMASQATQRRVYRSKCTLFNLTPYKQSTFSFLLQHFSPGLRQTASDIGGMCRAILWNIYFPTWARSCSPRAVIDRSREICMRYISFASVKHVTH